MMGRDKSGEVGHASDDTGAILEAWLCAKVATSHLAWCPAPATDAPSHYITLPSMAGLLGLESDPCMP